jgi:hypothetical protein
VGLLLATLSWLSYIFYDFNIGIFSRHTTIPLIVEDIPAVWGVGFRMAAAVIALIIVVFYVIKREFSISEATVALRFVLLFEALYFLSFLAAAFNVEGQNYLTYFTLTRFFEKSFPSFVDGLLLPAVLVKLFFELNPNKPKKGAIKWALIYVTAFIFAFWLNNSGEWIGTVLSKGINYLTQYPINLLSFVVTLLGLFLLFLYSAKFLSLWLKTNTLNWFNLRNINAVVTFLGLYPLFIFLLWLFFGSVGGWGTWYAWFLGHGYMSFIALPITFVTIPLLFRAHISSEGAKLGFEKQTTLNLNKKRLTSLLFLNQALGIIFFIIFTLAYYIPFPSRNFLIGTEPFFSLMRIFGTLYFIFSFVLIFLSFKTKTIDKPAIRNRAKYSDSSNA